MNYSSRTTDSTLYRRAYSERQARLMPLCLVCVLLSLLFAVGGAAGAENAFKPGEKATYQVRWSFVVAGHVDIAVESDSRLEESDARHFSLSARTLPFLDLFYKVRDRIDSYTDQGVNHSLLYRKVQTGKTKTDVEVLFDWRQKEVCFRNFEDKRQPVKIEDGTFDPLSAYFFLRSLDLGQEKNITRPVTDGKKLVLGKAKILRREKISVPAGRFETYLVEPDMKDVRGVFEKKKNARLLVWLTADSRHLLIKAESKVVVGSVVAELVSCSGLDNRQGFSLSSAPAAPRGATVSPD